MAGDVASSRRGREAPHSHFPYGTEGSGFYSDHLLFQYDVMEMATPMILSALGNYKHIPYSP